MRFAFNYNLPLGLSVFLFLTVLFSCDKKGVPGIEIEITAQDFVDTIAENSSEGTLLGTLQASVNEGTLSYLMKSANPLGALSVHSTTGELRILDASLFDFEQYKTLVGVVTASAGGKSKDINILITLTDVVETPPRTIWTGATITFAKVDGADPSIATNQDKITDNVWLTRGNSGGQIYNAVTETSSTKATSPSGTQWAEGTVDQIDNLTFTDFRLVDKPKNLVNKNLVLRLTVDNIYLNFKITSWSTGRTNAGGFAYERSTK